MILLLGGKMSIQITKCINSTIERIKDREHNIYLGISIQNQFFSRKNVSEYLSWAHLCSKDIPVILIADELQAYNYQAFYDMNYTVALSKAKAKGDEIHRLAERVIRNLSENYSDIKQIPILHIHDITTDKHREKQEILEKEFRDNAMFRSEITRIMGENLRTKSFSATQQDQLAKYLLTEIPLQNDLVYNRTHYDLYPYPGLVTGKFMDDLAHRRIFPDVADKIDMRTDNAFVEAYVV